MLCLQEKSYIIDLSRPPARWEVVELALFHSIDMYLANARRFGMTVNAFVKLKPNS